MTKIYSSFKGKLLLTFSALIIYATNGYSQNCTSTVVGDAANCAGPTESQTFNQNNGGFTATNLTYNLPANNDGSFESNGSIASGGIATLISPTYSYVNTPVIFRLEVEQGAGNFNYSVQLLDQNGNPIGNTCSGTTVNNTGDFICASFSNIPLNTNFKIRFTFTNKESNARALRLDNYAVGSTAGIVLPTKLTKFDVKSSSTGNQLSWTTTTDSKTKAFDIERSDNGNHYYNIGSVKASSQNSYSFTDKKPTQAIAYYKIKVVDEDGTFKYSAIVNVKDGKSNITLNGFPRPTKGKVTLQHNSIKDNTEILISGVDGKILQKIIPVRGAIETDIDLSKFANGLYFIKLNTLTKSEILKVIKE